MTKPMQKKWVKVKEDNTTEVFRLGRLHCVVEDFGWCFAWDVRFRAWAGTAYEETTLASGTNRSKEKAKSKCIKLLLTLRKTLNEL